MVVVSWGTLSLISAIACALVAFQKNDSVRSALLWAVAGLMFPIFSLVVVLVLPAKTAGKSSAKADAMVAEVAIHQQNYDPNKYISQHKWNDPVNDVDKKQKPKSANNAYWFMCPACLKKMKGNSELNGKKVKCPACKEPFKAMIVGPVLKAN